MRTTCEKVCDWGAAQSAPQSSSTAYPRSDANCVSRAPTLGTFRLLEFRVNRKHVGGPAVLFGGWNCADPMAHVSTQGSWSCRTLSASQMRCSGRGPTSEWSHVHRGRCKAGGTAPALTFASAKWGWCLGQGHLSAHSPGMCQGPTQQPWVPGAPACRPWMSFTRGASPTSCPMLPWPPRHALCSRDCLPSAFAWLDIDEDGRVGWHDFRCAPAPVLHGVCATHC